MKYNLVAVDESGNHLMELDDLDWREMSSVIAAWSKQFEKGVKGPDGLNWDQNGHIQVFPVLT